MKKHQKHTKIARPQLGRYHRNEWALVGAPSAVLQPLAGHLLHQLGEQYKLAWIDADHESREEEQHPGLKAGGQMAYTHKTSHHQASWKGEFKTHQQRAFFNEMDAVLVNGNHLLADQQIIVLHPAMKDSLSGQLDRLTDVTLILTTEDQQEPWDFLKEHIQGMENIPRLPFQQISRVADWMRRAIEQSVAPVNTLVLAGGKSTRMGHDKGAIEYHGKSQREYLLELTSPLTKEVFLSIRSDQQLESDGRLLKDTFEDLGPYGAILSAFREQPDRAWLVVACDLPLVDQETIQQLLDQRNPSKLATAFYNKATGFPDPLITLWEPRAYSVLLQFLAQGYSCARKVLIQSDIEMIRPRKEEALMNVNTPEDYEKVMELLKA